MNIKKFHIYLADLNPRFGTEPGKVRPVVVVQTDLLNTYHPSTIVCPLTTKITKGASILRVHLPKSESKLTKNSDILVDQIRAIDNKRFVKELGKLAPEQKRSLVENLKTVLLG